MNASLIALNTVFDVTVVSFFIAASLDQENASTYMKLGGSVCSIGYLALAFFGLFYAQRIHRALIKDFPSKEANRLMRSSMLLSSCYVLQAVLYTVLAMAV